jgi:hypothetical protein
MKVTPITETFRARNLPPRKQPIEATAEQKALQRYEALTQVLYDALTPFVDAYELRGAALTKDALHYELKVTLEDITRAQYALKVDIFV